MDKYDKALEYEIFIKKEYGFADETIKKAKIIFDVGGHIWLFSQYCLLLNPWCEIHYFEPIPKLYQQAQERLKNQNVILNNVGIASKTRAETIYFNSEKTMQTSVYNQTFLNPKWTGILVDMQNIEEYSVQQNIERIDLLKLDVEWMEYEILEALSDEFLQKIQALLLEFHLFTPEMEKKLDIIKKKLSKFFTIQYIPNSHNPLVWYLLFLNSL